MCEAIWIWRVGNGCAGEWATAAWPPLSHHCKSVESGGLTSLCKMSNFIFIFVDFLSFIMHAWQSFEHYRKILISRVINFSNATSAIFCCSLTFRWLQQSGLDQQLTKAREHVIIIELLMMQNSITYQFWIVKTLDFHYLGRQDGFSHLIRLCTTLDFCGCNE